jgi:hypothetical protein
VKGFDLNRWYSCQEVAEVLSVSVVTIRRRCQAGLIKATRLKTPKMGCPPYRIWGHDLVLAISNHDDTKPKIKTTHAQAMNGIGLNIPKHKSRKPRQPREKARGGT